MRNTAMSKESIKKHLNIHKKRLMAALAAVLAVIVLLTGIPAIQARAEFDVSTAVRFRTYKQSHTIENSVLFIGTHLIHIQAMTDQLYEKAVQSQSDSDQDVVYYKSELADGTWYDITEAAGLSAITSAGTPVSESELDDLYVAYYTGADGITRSAENGAVVCIYDDPDPYDLLKLPELEIVRQIRSQAYNEEEEGVHKYLYRSLNSFFASDVKNETTNNCDRTLKNLQKLYEAYCNAGLDEDAQVISSLMEGVDAARRAEVYAKLCQDGEPQTVSGALGMNFTVQSTSLLTELSKKVSGNYYDEKSDEYDQEPFELDSTLLDAVVTAIGECNTSYASYAGKALTESGSTIGSYIYSQMTSLVDMCEESDSISINDEITGIVNNIKYAQNIENGIVGDADAERRLLDEEFIPPAADAYAKALKTGTSAEYKAAVSANKSDTAKQAILKNDAVPLEVARTALETMISEYKKRVSASDAISYIYERITWTYDQENGIPKDDFAVQAKQSAADHIEWLTDLAKKIVDGDASLMSELERLKALLADYLLKQQDALDDGNPELAAQYNSLAVDTSAKIADEEARLNDILNSETATEAEKAAARIALGQTGLLSDINKLKNEALSAINNGETDSLQSTLDLLATLGGENALNDIKDALADSNLSSSDKNKWSEKVDAAIASSKNSSLHDQANATLAADGSSGSGAGTDGSGGSGAGTDGSGGSGAGTGGSGAGTGGSGAGTDGSGGSGTDGNGGSGAGTDGSGAGAGGSGAGTDGSGAGAGGNGAGTDGNGAGAGGSGTGAGGSGAGTGGSGAGGSSSTNPVTMSERALLNAIEQILGGSFDELDAEGKVAAATALDWLYDEYSNVNAKALAKQFITKCMSQRSPYVYTQLSGHPEAQYIPLSTIGNRSISSYRYVYSDSRQEATMTYGAKSYRFRVGAKVVTLTDGTEQEIQKYKVEFQNTPYIDEDTAKTYFNCEAEYIVDTKYGACLTTKVKEKADSLYEALTGQ